MCSGSEAVSYSRLIDFVYHSTLGLRVIKKKKKTCLEGAALIPPRVEELQKCAAVPRRARI